MRVPFDSLFTHDGAPDIVIAREAIAFGSVAIAAGASVSLSMPLGPDERLADLIGRELEIDVDGGLLIISGWY
ncbi:MAG TPA: hypothetical protein VGR62_26270 [Candidatus Binatia bacterium]|jgi:hypothetical protein|nr:hypothetical protein [Candidatus Binatia bacterium]